MRDQPTSARPRYDHAPEDYRQSAREGPPLCVVCSSITPADVLTIPSGEARRSDCLDARLSVYSEFNREFWMQFAELLNDAGRSIRIAQPPPADSANTLWIGYVAIRNRI